MKSKDQQYLEESYAAVKMNKNQKKVLELLQRFVSKDIKSLDTKVNGEKVISISFKALVDLAAAAYENGKYSSAGPTNGW
jgi:hypothetical protein